MSGWHDAFVSATPRRLILSLAAASIALTIAGCSIAATTASTTPPSVGSAPTTPTPLSNASVSATTPDRTAGATAEPLPASPEQSTGQVDLGYPNPTGNCPHVTDSGRAGGASGQFTQAPGPGISPTYVVAAGDDAWDISNRFGVGFGDMYDANGVELQDKNAIEAGQILTFPPFFWQNNGCVWQR